ncbi:MAG: hypothetical protein JW881_15545, partial [Spirochaetales bacterium]|nr:hypothetical protein [Spirochaetales bacterium]
HFSCSFFYLLLSFRQKQAGAGDGLKLTVTYFLTITEGIKRIQSLTIIGIYKWPASTYIKYGNSLLIDIR